MRVYVKCLFASSTLRWHSDGAGHVGLFLSGPQSSYGALPREGVRDRRPGLLAPNVGGWLSARPESFGFFGHSTSISSNKILINYVRQLLFLNNRNFIWCTG